MTQLWTKYTPTIVNCVSLFESGLLCAYLPPSGTGYGKPNTSPQAVAGRRPGTLTEGAHSTSCKRSIINCLANIRWRRYAAYTDRKDESLGVRRNDRRWLTDVVGNILRKRQRAYRPRWQSLAVPLAQEQDEPSRKIIQGSYFITFPVHVARKLGAKNVTRATTFTRVSIISQRFVVTCRAFAISSKWCHQY